MTTMDYILQTIQEFVGNNPDLRFTQVLERLGINTREVISDDKAVIIDNLNDEDVDVYSRMVKIIVKLENDRSDN